MEGGEKTGLGGERPPPRSGQSLLWPRLLFLGGLLLMLKAALLPHWTGPPVPRFPTAPRPLLFTFYQSLQAGDQGPRLPSVVLWLTVTPRCPLPPPELSESVEPPVCVAEPVTSGWRAPGVW